MVKRSDEPINETAASILGFLTMGPMSGWDINELARVSVNYFWNMTRSQIYRELADLADKGLVRAEGAGPRNRTRFHLTDPGRARLQAWLREPPKPATARDPFLVKLFFASELSSDELDELVEHARRQHEDAGRRYAAAVAMAEQVSPFMAATAKWGQAVNRAALRWFADKPWRSLD